MEEYGILKSVSYFKKGNGVILRRKNNGGDEPNQGMIHVHIYNYHIKIKMFKKHLPYKVILLVE
jgi:hypothetical protein